MPVLSLSDWEDYEKEQEAARNAAAQFAHDTAVAFEQISDLSELTNLMNRENFGSVSADGYGGFSLPTDPPTYISTNSLECFQTYTPTNDVITGVVLPTFPTIPAFVVVDPNIPLPPTPMELVLPLEYKSPDFDECRYFNYDTPSSIHNVYLAPLNPIAFPPTPDSGDFSYDAPAPIDPISITPLGAFVFPTIPPSRDMSYDIPAALSTATITYPAPMEPSAVPTFSQTLTVDTAGQPGSAPVDTFGDAPIVVMPEFPADLSYTVPSAPSIDGIVVPQFGAVATIDTTITLPTPIFPAIQGEVDFTNSLWTSADVDDMAAHMARVRAGDFAISTTIWRQIYDRAAMALRREAIARERAGRRAWARQGWMMPGGVALAQQELAAHDINESTSAKALEIAVQEAVQKSDEFWKAITNGATLEGMYQAAHTAYQERGLRYAIAVQQASVAVYNAYAARYGVEVAIVQANIESVRLKIENERMKLEGNKLQIEAALARGEADKLELQLYIAQWEGVKSIIAAYTAEIEAVKANLDAQKLLLEGFNLNLQGYSTRVGAWAKKWDGYTAKMQGENTKATVFDSYVRAYVGDIQGYSAAIQEKTARSQVQIENAKLQATMAELDVSRYKAEWDGVIGRLDATAKVVASEVSRYNAELQGVTALASTQADYAKIQASAAEVDISRYKAEWDAVGVQNDAVAKKASADATIYSSTVQGITASVTAEAEYAKAKAVVAEVDVSRYKADWEGISAHQNATATALTANTSKYTAEVQGKIAEIGAQSDYIKAQAVLAEAENARYRAEWEGNNAQLDKKIKETTAHAAVYTSSVQGLATITSAEAEVARVQGAIIESDVSRYKAELDGFSARVDAVARQATANAAVYGAAAQASAASSQSLTDWQKVDLEAKRITMTGKIEAAKQWADQMMEAMRLAETAQIALGNIYAQINAAQLSQFNYSQSSSASNNQSQTSSDSYSLSINKSCECN